MIAESTTKTIMVIGETGSGKTTLLNAMLNYCEEVEFKDPFRYELVDERDLKKRGYGGAKSCTQSVTSYLMKCRAT
jgi:septin family protein